MMTGILVKAIAGFCYVECDGEIYECKPRGNLRKSGLYCGDSVEFSVLRQGKGVVEAVHLRKNSLVRPPISNLDRLYIVSAHNTPAPNALLIDRIAALCEKLNIEPIIVFNKSDLGSLKDWANIYSACGYKTFVVSALEPQSLSELKAHLLSFSGISAFTGNSGVGKSSILNAVFPELSLQTGSVSEKLGRGRHTTRQVELFKLPAGGYIADTPGFSSLDITKCEVIFKEELPHCFREFLPYTDQCRFHSCTHLNEPDCAVKAAVLSGEIPKSRYESYCALYDEVKDLKKWNTQKKTR